MNLTKYSLSKLAQIDLQQIADYTLEQWNEDQAKAYLTSIRQQFSLLMSFPAIGQDFESNTHKELRYWGHKSHLIFYVVRDDQELFIVRVFHKKQNYYAHFE